MIVHPADKLISYVVKKAEEEARAIIERAELEASRILEGALEERKRRVEAERKRFEEEARRRRDVILSDARRKARLTLNATISKIIADVERKTWEYLESLSLEERRASIEKLLEEAFLIITEGMSDRLREKRLTLMVSSGDLEIALEIARKLEASHGVKIVVEATSMRGGVIVVDPETGVVVDNSYESRMVRALRIIASEIKREYRNEVISRSI